MNLRDLKYILAVAEYGHFGRAAQACHISQPTLSMQIQKVEEELGVKIFERNNKQLQLTAVGEQVIVEARYVLEHVESMKQLAVSAQNPLSGVLRVGIIPSLCPYLLDSVFPSLRKSLPDIEWHFTEQQTEPLLTQLVKGELDVVVMAQVEEIPSQLVSHPFYEEVLYLALPKQHKWANEKVTWKMAEQLPLLLLEEGHCLRDHVKSWCLKNAFRNELSVQSLETLMVLVEQQQGISLIPALMKQHYTKKSVPQTIVFKRLQRPVPRRTLTLLVRKSDRRVQLKQHLLTLLRDTLSHLMLDEH